MPWTRATHLDQWADTEFASRHLPLLVRRLVRKTVPNLTKLNIPANEQTVRPGFDGVVECGAGNQYVPSGKSVWEMGTDQNPKAKAGRDIKKRTKELSDAARSETTFVFVTPRPWQRKDEWAIEKAEKDGWKKVVVHDSNDLEHWLDLAPGVDAWISHETKQIPAGVQSLESHWSSLREVGKHTLHPEVFTASRETEIQAVVDLLNRDPDSLFLQTPSLSDGIDFLAALASQEFDKFWASELSVEPKQLSLLQNAVIVFDQDDWRQLTRSDGPLLLIASPTLQVTSTDVASAVQANHYVIVSGPRGIVPAEKGVLLRGLQQYELEKALEVCGYSESQAGSLSKSCAGNTTILKRRIATHPETLLPNWSTPEVGPSLSTFALIGGWAHVDPNPPPQEDMPEAFRNIPPIDLSVLELVGYSTDEIDRLVAQWQAWPEPLFLQLGDSVLVTSREDAWYLLGNYVTDKQLKQFSDLAILVLEEDNPAFELEADQRWMANIYGKRHSISGELRKSLVETLAVMATCLTMGHSSPDKKFTATIESVINSVLPQNCDWKRWASLRGYLGIIAEAAPDLFLSRIEEDLESSAQAIPQLFQEQTGSVFGGWLHCELLWALETLAWSPEYLLRVSTILAKLVPLIPPPGNHGNRPESSLREIFLLWLPHTKAGIKDRISALKQVLQIEPAVGWKLLLNLLPEGHSGISHNTSMPRWRPWADGWSREAIQDQLYDYAMAVANLALEELGDNPTKWADALESMLRFNEQISKLALAALKETAGRFKARTNDAFKLWEALRLSINNHENFSDADWAFPKETIDSLVAIRDQLVPADLVLKNQWLFDAHAELAGFRNYKFEEREKALEKARTQAVREILNVGGIEDIWRLIELGADSSSLGFVCGKHALVNEQEIKFSKSLTNDDKARALFASSYAIASYYQRGEWNWIESLGVSDWSTAERTQLALCLPFEPKVWDWVEGQEKEVQTRYWSQARAFLRNFDLSIIRRAAEGLIEARRPFSAIDLINFHRKSEVPSDLIAAVLEAGISLEASEEIGDIGYDIQELIGLLQADENFDRNQLARLEWEYLPFLEKSYSKTGPDTLAAAVKENPSFYVELIQTAYRGKTDLPNPSNDSDKKQFHARRSGEFLDDLESLPGMDESGNIDPESLGTWIHSVLELSEASGHSEIASHKIGQYIGRSIYQHLDNKEVLSQLATVMKSEATNDLTDGIVNGILNSRGVSTRSPFDGGEQEHKLAEKYANRASVIRDLSPKLAKVFTTIQSHYDQDAKRWDKEASRLRLGR